MRKTGKNKRLKTKIVVAVIASSTAILVAIIQTMPVKKIEKEAVPISPIETTLADNAERAEQHDKTQNDGVAVPEAMPLMENDHGKPSATNIFNISPNATVYSNSGSGTQNVTINN